MRPRAAVWTLLIGLLCARPAAATVADDLCAAADDPCVVDGPVDVTPASSLDFGVRALEIRRGGVLDVGDGSLTIIARSVRVFAGGAILARGGDTPRTIAITTSGALSVDGTDVARGRIDVSGPTAGQIILANGGAFTLGGELNARGIGAGAAGGTITVTALVVTVAPSARLIAAGGADEAGGEITLSAPGQTLALGGTVDVSGGSGGGGTIALDAGPSEVTASIDARSRIGEGDGGVVDIESTGTVFLRGPVVASSDCRIDETCLSTGGEVTIDTTSGGAVIVDGAITLTGAGIDGTGGTLTIDAATDVVQRGTVLVNGRGSAGCGGEVAITAGANITLGTIDAGGRDCDGGTVSAVVDGLGRVTAAGEIDADGKTGGGGGIIEFEGVDVVIAASVHASSGMGLGGTVTIDACGSIEVAGGADVTTRGDRGENIFAAVRGMTIDGDLTSGTVGTGAGGTNELRFRSQANPPVIADGVVVTPAATLVLDPALPTCVTPGAPGCGNGVLDDGEACDDFNTDPCDGCSATCQLEGCGNHRVECGEQCDDGNADACDGCSPSCTTESCGNARAECDEECDDGSANGMVGSSCGGECKLLPPPGCGQDGVGPGETCDDGNATACDLCSPICQVEACGTDVLECGEECDDGNQEGCDGCSAACKLESCGDGVVQCEEDCDDGQDNNGKPGSTCDDTCHFGTLCGLVTNESPCIPCAGDTDCDPVGRCGGKMCSEGVCVEVAAPGCDDQRMGTIDRCVLDGAGAPVCQHECTGDAVCDDGDRCTTDSCAGVQGCVNAPVEGVGAVSCRVDGMDDVLAGRGDEVRPKLARKLSRRLEKISKRLAAAAAADAAGATRRERKLLKKVVGGLRGLERMVKRAQRKNKISAELAQLLLEATGAASSAAVEIRAGLGT